MQPGCSGQRNLKLVIDSFEPTSQLAAQPSADPIHAPWIRPGVVLHNPEDTIDGLLAEFALVLKARGFNVAGYVQRNNRGCNGKQEGCAPRIDYFDLASSSSLLVERGAAIHYLRKALSEDADLLVISRFSACTEATDSVQALVGPDISQGMPLLTSIAGQCIHKWHSYFRQDGAMIAPDINALWSWWGPERIYKDLALGVDASEVRRIVCGQRWIMVEGEHGVGLAYLPKHPRDLLPRLPRLSRHSLRELALFTQSWDPLEMALGIAAINAHYNRFDLDGLAGNGTKKFRQMDGRVVVIGAFPGIEGILPGAAIIETDPKPGEYPLIAMDSLLPGCGAAIVNSSALINRSLPRILRLARNRPVGMIGPSTPMTPRLYDYGLPLLGGLIVSDADGLAAAIRSGAHAKEFSRFGRYAHIMKTQP